MFKIFHGLDLLNRSDTTSTASSSSASRKSEVTEEDEMSNEQDVEMQKDTDGKPKTVGHVQKLDQRFRNRLGKSRTSGAAKKKSKRMNRFLDHYRLSPHVPYSVPFYWPNSMKDYVVRCYDTCKNEEEKKRVQDMLKEKMLDFHDDGVLFKHNWRDEPVLRIIKKS